jgi:A/G-specific adenine glycosylase
MEPVAVVDGNVFRRLSRYFDVETDIASAPPKKVRHGFELMPKDESDFNQAIMEFGHYSACPKS